MYGRVGSILGITILPLFYLKDSLLTKYPVDTLYIRLFPWVISILFLVISLSKLRKNRQYIALAYFILLFSYYAMLIVLFITNFTKKSHYLSQLITSLILILVIIYIFSPGLKRDLPLLLGAPYLGLITYIFIYYRLTPFEMSLFFNPSAVLVLLIVIGIFTEKIEIDNFIKTQALKRNRRSLQKEVKKSLSYMEQLEKCALLDEMTGVYNRNAADRILEKDIIKMKLSGKKFFLSYMDLNDLKIINDTRGHMEGDKYIKNFVNSINSQTRVEDVLFRMGGDEFLLLLKGISKKNFHDLSKRLKNLCSTKGISYSIGTVNQDDLVNRSPVELINLADRRMYENKAREKGLKSSSHTDTV